jgi:hypothetical protein
MDRTEYTSFINIDSQDTISNLISKLNSNFAKIKLYLSDISDKANKSNDDVILIKPHQSIHTFEYIDKGNSISVSDYNKSIKEDLINSDFLIGDIVVTHYTYGGNKKLSTICSVDGYSEGNIKLSDQITLTGEQGERGATGMAGKAGGQYSSDTIMKWIKTYVNDNIFTDFTTSKLNIGHKHTDSDTSHQFGFIEGYEPGNIKIGALNSSGSETSKIDISKNKITLDTSITTFTGDVMIEGNLSLSGTNIMCNKIDTQQLSVSTKLTTPKIYMNQLYTDYISSYNGSKSDVIIVNNSVKVLKNVNAVKGLSSIGDVYFYGYTCIGNVTFDCYGGEENQEIMFNEYTDTTFNGDVTLNGNVTFGDKPRLDIKLPTIRSIDLKGTVSTESEVSFTGKYIFNGDVTFNGSYNIKNTTYHITDDTFYVSKNKGSEYDYYTEKISNEYGQVVYYGRSVDANTINYTYQLEDVLTNLAVKQQTTLTSPIVPCTGNYYIIKLTLGTDTSSYNPFYMLCYCEQTSLTTTVDINGRFVYTSSGSFKYSDLNSSDDETSSSKSSAPAKIVGGYTNTTVNNWSLSDDTTQNGVLLNFVGAGPELETLWKSDLTQQILLDGYSPVVNSVRYLTYKRNVYIGPFVVNGVDVYIDLCNSTVYPYRNNIKYHLIDDEYYYIAQPRQIPRVYGITGATPYMVLY